MATVGTNNMEIPHNWHLNSDGTYDVEGDVHISDKYVRDGKLTIKFGKVTGAFHARGIGLTSLEGCPMKVGGNFDCFNNRLTSLEGTPESVCGKFDCSNNQLTSLEGAPKSVSGRFDCDGNNITALYEVPKGVKQIYYPRALRTISATLLPLIEHSWISNKHARTRHVDWAEVSTPVYKYAQWILKDSRINHINMTSQQERELKALQMSWL